MSETLIGVIIGGVIGIVGILISQYIVIYNKRKDIIFERKEKMYFKAIEYVSKYYTLEIDDRELKIGLIDIHSNMAIYSTEKIHKYFSKIISAIQEDASINKINHDEIGSMIRTFRKMIKDDINNSL